jgi:D-sedoheptulose 7-phosphate isomerase
MDNREALDAIDRGGRLLVDVFKRGGRVYSCGNGGSMCDAMHFAEELTGRYRLDRPALPATAISDAGHLTCVGNDLGYEHVFSRYVEAHGRAGDCLVALSTSGTSKNVLRAVEVAKARGMDVIALSGREAEFLRLQSTVFVCTPAGRFADRVQELHIKALHIFIELVERELFPANYPA